MYSSFQTKTYGPHKVTHTMIGLNELMNSLALMVQNRKAYTIYGNLRQRLSFRLGKEIMEGRNEANCTADHGLKAGTSV